MRMSTSIRVNEDTKKKLEKLKRDEETWDDFLDRLVNRGASMNPGTWEGTDKAEKAREAIKRSQESFDR